LELVLTTKLLKPYINSLAENCPIFHYLNLYLYNKPKRRI